MLSRQGALQETKHDLCGVGESGHLTEHRRGRAADETRATSWKFADDAVCAVTSRDAVRLPSLTPPRSCKKNTENITKSSLLPAVHFSPVSKQVRLLALNLQRSSHLAHQRAQLGRVRRTSDVTHRLRLGAVVGGLDDVSAPGSCGCDGYWRWGGEWRFSCHRCRLHSRSGNCCGVDATLRIKHLLKSRLGRALQLLKHMSLRVTDDVSEVL